MRSFFNIAAMLIIMFGLSFCTASQVECPPDNQAFVVHKNPEKEFPVYASESRSEINIALDALEQLRQAPLQASTIQELTQLQNTLSTISSNFEATAREPFMSYHKSPCEANIDYFRIMNEVNHIREMGDEFSRIAENNGNPDEGRIMEIVNTYREYSKTEGIQSF